MREDRPLRAMRRIREKRGWSQRDLAVRSGVDQTAISFYENGRRDPSLSSLIRLSRALGVSVGTLIKQDDPTEHGSGEPEPPMDVLLRMKGAI